MTILELLEHSVLGSAITAIATLLAVVITNYHNKKVLLINNKNKIDKDKTERKLQKIEELYLIFSKWKNDTLKTTTLYAGYHNGKFSQAEINKNLPTVNGGLTYDPSKISVIIHIFFPELIKLSNEINKCHIKLYISYKPMLESNKTFIPTILKNQDIFDCKCDEILEQLSLVAKNLQQD
ncbi:TPA: hypothetical protein ACX6QX_000118 [Photobacterium damselae]